MLLKVAFILVSIIVINGMLISQLSVSTKLGVTGGAIFSVTNKSLINFPDGNIKNGGLVYVDNNIENYDSIKGSLSTHGTFRLGQDWVNNGFFISDSSTVDFFGGDQFIKGNNITTFHNLLLNGNGLKIQELDAKTHFLDLTINELATQGFVMEILSIDTNAISRIDGFVSSLQDGHLKRHVNQVASYLFPVGSSKNGTRLYRPITITPTNVTTNIYGVRLAHENASNDGYFFNQTSNKLKKFNESFYHHIYNDNHTNNANISFFYKPVEDGLYKNVGHWENNNWEANYNEFVSTNTLFNIMTINNVSNFDTRAFVLANRVDEMFIPNAFTPNGDGLNDVFEISLDKNNYSEFNFVIFNRWGQVIFETQNPNFSWNGIHKNELSQTGIYPWLITYTLIESSIQEVKRGHITLIN